MVSGDLKVKLAVSAALVLAAAGGLYYIGRRASGAAAGAIDTVKSAAAAVVDAVNPASENNLAYKGANVMVQSVTGDPYQTLGGWLFDMFSSKNQEVAASLSAPVAPAWTAADQEDADMGYYMELAAAEQPYLNYSRAFKRSTNR